MSATTLCPSCGHNSETCYRCSECGKDLTNVDTTKDTTTTDDEVSFS